MHFFFDESGDFAIPDTGEHKCSVVCGLVVPETVENTINAALENFVSQLEPTEKQCGEPKGYLLTEDSLKRFCHLLR